MMGFLAGICLLAGCGAEDKLLLELRQEESVGLDAPGNAGEAEEGEGAGQSVDVGAGERAGQETESGNIADAGASRETGTIYVHVCGAVASPGVYGMPEGSRFYEAVDMAGGFAEDACRDYLNMAAPLADGSRLEIPALEEIREREKAEDQRDGSDAEDDKEKYNYYTVKEEPATDAGSAEAGNTNSPGVSAEGLVNINTADIAGLCALPGIGEGRAKAIIEYREKQGGFQKKEDIMQVSGIGEKMYARMEGYLCIE